MKPHLTLTFKIIGYTLVVLLVSLLGREVTSQRSSSGQRTPSSVATVTCLDLLPGLIGEVGVRDKFKVRYLKKFSKLVEKQSARARDIDELVDLLARETRPRFSDHLNLSQLTERLTKEALIKEALAKGIQQALEERGVLVANRTVLSKFFSSKSGEFLKTSFGAIGVPWGLPPLYLPSGALVELTGEQLTYFTQLPFDEAFELFILSIGQKEFARFERQVLYHYMRERYLKFASVATTILSAYWFYESYQITLEQEENLSEFESGAQEMLAGVNYFEQQGISFEKVDKEQTQRSRQCLFAHDCVSSQGVLPSDEEYNEYYQACVEFLKMGSECQTK